MLEQQVFKKISKRKQRADNFRTAARKGEKYVKQKAPEEEIKVIKAQKEQARKEKEIKKEKKEQERKKEQLRSDAETESLKSRKRKAETTESQVETKKPKMQEPTVDTKIKGARFIVFVGNLPYSATQELLNEHLAACKPDVIRIPTDKKTGRVKGFAFAEFIGSDASKRMKACLRLHHTDYGGRRINIELTAGGGGKGESRQQKLKEKNEKLEEERSQLKQASVVKSREKANVQSNNKTPESAESFVHPSRMTRIN
ncbi:hypothetical protein V1514DRAFT_338996 [Lipomyces japonicus]|uniref:uncharacterized protein n=1 Tax=Lipomyces japonicus TaxID=56871 RepID=UPI0034CFDF58